MFENKIFFEAEDEFYFENSLKPEPAVKNMPQWWKSMPKYAPHLEEYAVTVKGCGPTLDSLASGYILKLWHDIEVRRTSDGNQEVSWNISNADEHHSQIMIDWHKDQVSTFEIPEGFSSTVLKYRHGWIIKTPPGWSTMFIHPIGYNNLPIRSITGLVDTDILKTDINVPFMIKSSFEGIIPKGTPISQMIPVKRENWKAVYKVIDEEEFLYEKAKLGLLNMEYYVSKRERKNYK